MRTVANIPPIPTQAQDVAIGTDVRWQLLGDLDVCLALEASKVVVPDLLSVGVREWVEEQRNMYPGDECLVKNPHAVGS